MDNSDILLTKYGTNKNDKNVKEYLYNHKYILYQALLALTKYDSNRKLEISGYWRVNVGLPSNFNLERQIMTYLFHFQSSKVFISTKIYTHL